MSFSFPPIISVCCTAFIVNFFGIQKGVVLSERTRDLEELRLVADDFLVQYLELLELRAKVASLLFPLKALPRRRQSVRRSRLTIRALQRDVRPTAA